MGLKDKILAPVTAAREKAPWFDHLVQAGSRYTADQGNQLAAAVTYFSFLSLFPLALLVASVLGYVLKGNPDLQAKVLSGIQNALPGKTGADLLATTVNNAGKVGITGLLGLLYSGLGWVGNLRTAIRTVWHQNVNAGNFVTSKVQDIIILVGLGATLALSVAITGVGNAATTFVLKQIGLATAPGAAALVKIIAILLAMVADVAIFLWLFIRLPRVQTPWRRILKGAVFAAVGFEILKIVGSYYIARTTKNPAYGTLGTVVGALVFINLASRYVIYSAVWTVTAPYDDDIAPSGTADRATAREAGIPEEFADETASDAAPNTRQQDSSPTPLTPAIQGKPGVGYGDANRRRVEEGHAERGQEGSGDAERGSNADRRGVGSGGQHAAAGLGGARGGAPSTTGADPYPPARSPSSASATGRGRAASGAALVGAAGALIAGARSIRGRFRR